MLTSLSKRHISLLVAIFIVALTLRPAITSIGPLLDIILKDLSLTNSQVSLLTSVPVICMGIFASLAPVLNRRLGLHKTMYMMLGVIGIATAIRGFISTYILLLVTAFFIGIAIAVIGPLLSAMIKQHFPRNTSFAIGIYSFGIGVGAMLSSGLSGIIFEKTNSYLFALGCWSIIALVSILVWAVSMQQIDVVQEAIVERQTTSPWKVKKAWYILLFFGLQTALFFSIMTWLVPILTSKGISIIQAGGVLSVMSGVQIMTNLLIPLGLAKINSKTFWVVLLSSFGILAILSLWYIGGLTVWLSAVLLGVALGATFPIALQFPLDLTTSANETNDWTAMMQTGGFIFSGLTPFFIGFLYDATGNHEYSLAFIILLFISMIVITLVIEKK